MSDDLLRPPLPASLGAGEIDLNELVERFRLSALSLIDQAEYWEIRVHGGNGKARIELIQQTEPITFRKARSGQSITTLKQPGAREK